MRREERGEKRDARKALREGLCEKREARRERREVLCAKRDARRDGRGVLCGSRSTQGFARPCEPLRASQGLATRNRKASQSLAKPRKASQSLEKPRKASKSLALASQSFAISGQEIFHTHTQNFAHRRFGELGSLSRVESQLASQAVEKRVSPCSFCFEP